MLGAFEHPISGPKSQQEGVLEVEKLRKNGVEIYEVGHPTGADVATNISKLQAAVAEFKQALKNIEVIHDPGLRNVEAIAAVTRINTILENENIQPQNVTLENKRNTAKNTSRSDYKEKLETLDAIRNIIETRFIK